MARIFSNTDFGLARALMSFHNTKFELNGVQNRAVFSSLSNMSQDNLQNFAKIINKNLDTNNIKTSSNLAKNYEFSNEISFTDKISTNTINLRLSDENLSRLKTHFGSQNFDKDKSGKITLKGEAADFVSGWFGDIAYKRNYAGADSDKNGFLNDSEKGKTLAGYGALVSYKTDEKDGSNVVLVQMDGVSSYLPYSKHYDAPLANTIEKALNESLKADINMDGYLNLIELQSKEQIIKSAKKTIEGETPTQTGEGGVDLLEELMKKLKKRLEELSKRLNLGDIDELAKSLDKDLQSLAVSLKVSKETLIENLDNADFASNLRSLIDEIKQNAKKSVQIDISA